MENRKIEERQDTFTISVNGKPVQAYPGDTIHAALIRAGYNKLRTSKTEQPRGVFCGMGTCFECLVTVDGSLLKQSCMTRAEEGMEILIDEDRSL